MMCAMQQITFETQVYKISFEAMKDQLEKRLQKEAMMTYLQLLERVQMQPKVVYQEIKDFAKDYSDVPEVINLLTFAHIQNRKIVEAEKLIQTTYENHPNYLFAKINYADQCIRKKKLERVEEIFPTFDLKELCPEKEVFHTSEFRGFLIMMAYYSIARKEREKAIHYFEAAKQVEPNHMSVVHLEKKLFRKSLLRRLLRLKK